MINCSYFDQLFPTWTLGSGEGGGGLGKTQEKVQYTDLYNDYRNFDGRRHKTVIKGAVVQELVSKLVP